MLNVKKMLTNALVAIKQLKTDSVSKASAIVTIPIGTGSGGYDCGQLATLFGVSGIDQSYVISAFGYIRQGNTQSLDNNVHIMIYNNHLYIRVYNTVSNMPIVVGVIIQYKMP